jgi:hypothetical protein
VCVIDTGINFQNELYGSCTGVNAPKGQCRVVTGFNFVGDGYNGRLDGPAAVRGGLPVRTRTTTLQQQQQLQWQQVNGAHEWVLWL